MPENVPFRVTDEFNKETSSRNLALDYDHILTFIASDATPTVKNLTRFKGAGTAVTITNFDDGQQAQVIYVIGDDATIVAHNANIKRASGAAGVLTQDKVYSFLYDTAVWYEIGGAAAFSGANVTHDTTVSVPNSTPQILAFNTVNYDTDGYHDAGSNTKLTIQKAGAYRITATVEFSLHNAGTRRVTILLNGTDVIGRFSGGNAGGVSLSVVTATCDWKLEVDDELEVEVYQDSGGPLDINAADFYSPVFSLQYLGVVP